MVQVHIDSDPDDAELPPAYTLEGRPTPNPAGSANIGLGQDANVFGTGGPPSPSQQNIAPPSDAQRALAPLWVRKYFIANTSLHVSAGRSQGPMTLSRASTSSIFLKINVAQMYS